MGMRPPGTALSAVEAAQLADPDDRRADERIGLPDDERVARELHQADGPHMPVVVERDLPTLARGTRLAAASPARPKSSPGFSATGHRPSA
jgi:hypothetical protein